MTAMFYVTYISSLTISSLPKSERSDGKPSCGKVESSTMCFYFFVKYSAFTVCREFLVMRIHNTISHLSICCFVYSAILQGSD